MPKKKLRNMETRINDTIKDGLIGHISGITAVPLRVNEKGLKTLLF
jgi:hypothetical protein